MFGGASQDLGKRNKWSLFTSSLSFALLVVAVILGDSRPAYTLPLPRVQAIPAFARKYGLPCSACHEAWPKLNNFGQTFKDNGYQLGNDRDAPIWQQPSYWPVAMRITPHWHRVSTDHVEVIDPNDSESILTQRVTTHGFDIGGLDILAGGTLAKNISFMLVPAVESSGSGLGFEAAFVRFDNLLNSSWLNLKVGKFELDNMLSEKRSMTLSDVGGGYQLYHFMPAGEELNAFGLGDNQLGMEWMGHSKNDYTRFSIAMLSSNDGNVGLPNGHGYDGYVTFSQAFSAGSLGLQRVGAFGYVGRAPTYFLTGTDGTSLDGLGQKSFYRAGVFGMWYIKKFDVTTMYMRGAESAFLANNTPANTPLDPAARGAQWNGLLFEPHYTVNPQLILIGRYELVRMARQAMTTNASDYGNLDIVTIGYRYYPFMTSRAGFAFHNEYSWMRQKGTGPAGPLGSGLDLATNSLFLGFDFIF